MVSLASPSTEDHLHVLWPYFPFHFLLGFLLMLVDFAFCRARSSASLLVLPLTAVL